MQFIEKMVIAGLIGLGTVPVVQADEVLLFDDFNSAALDTGKWVESQLTLGRTVLGNPVTFGTEGGTGFMSLPLDTYAPGNPGNALFGSHVYAKQPFTRGDGLELEARLRTKDLPQGVVASAFLFNFDAQSGGQDEVDVEILTQQPSNRFLATSWDSWIAGVHGYNDQIHHSGALVGLDGYDFRQWNTYTIRWYPNRVEWYLNSKLVRSIYTPVPNANLYAHMNVWAPGVEWGEAYSAALQPTANSSSGASYRYDVDYIKVSRLGASPQPPTPPANPTSVTLQRKTTADWGTGYCEQVTVTNPNTLAIEWSAALPISGQSTSVWGATLTNAGNGTYTATGASYNKTLAGGASTLFGFCANKSVSQLPASAIKVTRLQTSAWGGGYCEQVTVTNTGTSPGTWQVTLPIQGTLNNSWSAAVAQQGSSLNVSGLEWNKVLSPNATTRFGFCATR